MRSEQGMTMMDKSSAIAEFDRQDHGGIDAPPMVSADERRMQVRAYNHWSTLLGQRQWPAIEDLDLSQLDYGDHAILLDFTMGSDDPAIVYLGEKLRQQGEIANEIRSISQVPRGSLVSRLTDHYLQIIANGAPIGFEAEYRNAAGSEILYRGILLPFSADDESIDFILGVINWKEAMPALEAAALQNSIADLLRAPQDQRSLAAWADGPHADFDSPDVESDGLYNHLADARIFADQARDESARGRLALYRAIGKAWDFALAAEGQDEVVKDMLEDCGIKAQARAPMTAIAKLVFGANYDKTRLAEIAAILNHARETQMAEASVAQYLEQWQGGIKALVKQIRAERRQERPRTPSRKIGEAMEKLRAAAPIATIMDNVEAGHAGHAGDQREMGEFILLLARRDALGKLAVVARAGQNEAMVQKAVKGAKLLR